jgi:hypothetical protein
MLYRILSALTTSIPTAHDTGGAHFHAGPRGPYACSDDACGQLSGSPMPSRNRSSR